MELGGFYYKSGQKIASNIANMSPKVGIVFAHPSRAYNH
jgi:hypothetical protein